LGLADALVDRIDVSKLERPIIVASGNDAAVVADLREVSFPRGGLHYSDVTQDRLLSLDEFIGTDIPGFVVVAATRYLDGQEMVWRWGPWRNRLQRLDEPND